MVGIGLAKNGPKNALALSRGMSAIIFVWSLVFSDARNSMYVGQVI